MLIAKPGRRRIKWWEVESLRGDPAIHLGRIEVMLGLLHNSSLFLLLATLNPFPLCPTPSLSLIICHHHFIQCAAYFPVSSSPCTRSSHLPPNGQTILPTVPYSTQLLSSCRLLVYFTDADAMSETPCPHPVKWLALGRTFNHRNYAKADVASDSAPWFVLFDLFNPCLQVMVGGGAKAIYCTRYLFTSHL